MVMINDVMVIYNDDDDDDGDDVDGYGDDDDEDGNEGDYDWRGVGNDYGDDDDDDDGDDDDDDIDDDDIFVKFSQNVGPFIAKSGLFGILGVPHPPSLRTGLPGWRMCSWEGLQFQTFLYNRSRGYKITQNGFREEVNF